MDSINLKLDKQRTVKISLTLLTFLITIILPLISYIQFKITLSNNIELKTLNLKYKAIFISTIIIGISISGTKYYSLKLPQYSIKRGIFALLNSVLFVIFLIITAQIGIINLHLEHSSFYLNLSGLFITIIIIWILFALKNLFDLIDYKIHHIYYDQISRTKRKKFTRTPFGNLIACPHCNYNCRIQWKKCPICNTQLLIKN